MSRWSNKYVIGLTGNIAVGKSVVRQMLQHLGAYTIDADGLAHQAMAPGAPGYKPVVETFGMFVMDPDKRINRAKLANIVFTHPEALRRLEAITHPIVEKAIDTLVTRAKQPIVVVEAIKLLEGNLAEWVDEVWVVDATPQLQLQRLMQRRKMPEDIAKRRIVSQNPQKDKLAKADLVINNSGNVEETWKQVQAGWTKTIQKLQAERAAETQDQGDGTEAPDATMDTAVTKPLVEKVDNIEVKRGMPNNAEMIAQFISKSSGKEVSRMDVMMSFGQKSYLIAQSSDDSIDALMGWQVENLITRVDEFYIDESTSVAAAVKGLVIAVENASRELQSEVGFIFLPSSTADNVVQTFVSNGYERTEIKDIKIPAWREAVQELSSDTTQVLMKKLREDRVLKPI